MTHCARRSLSNTFLLVLILFLLAGSSAFAQSAIWAGEWDGRWRNGGARLALEQQGDRVSGIYLPYGGKIEGIAKGRELVGHWTRDEATETFTAVQSPDGRNFTARLGSGEWWTGVRTSKDQEFLGQPVDQSSPAMTIHHFLMTMNAVGPGKMELLSEASHLIDWTALPELKISQVDYTQRLFDVLDRLTFRPWDLQRSHEGQSYQTMLAQSGSDLTIALGFVKRGQDWFILPPPVDLLDERLREMKVFRQKKDIRKISGFQSPRDTIRSLVTRFDDADRTSVDQVIDAMDLSRFSALEKKYEAPRLAGYLQRTLSRVGTPTWQEIPDDPNSLEPYVYFEHPVGQIVVAPVDTEQGTVWKFTQDTLKNIRPLYSAIAEMPLSSVLQNQRVSRSPYFIVRDTVADWHDTLVVPVGPMELWQWLGLICALALAYFMGLIVSIWVGVPLLRYFEKNFSEHPFYQISLSWALRLLFMGMTLRSVDEPLGLPDVVEVLVLTLSWSAIILSVAIFLLILVNLVAERIGDLRSLAGHNITLVSLTAGVLRVVVLLSALLLLADVLEIPYQGVLAGLGIGGLAVALAAQSTLQNFISGITLYFDKPIAIGDYCRFGSREGTVEFIGMRSTRIRTLDRTVVTIPNSEFSNMQIENYAQRDRLFLNTTLQLRYETTPDQLRYVLAEIRKLLLAHPKVASEPLRVRFNGFGAYSLDIEIFAYVLTNSKPEFLAIREDIFLRMMVLIKDAGAQFAFPSAVHYEAKDAPSDEAKVRDAEAAVARWREQGNLPFPDLSWQEKFELRETLDYPPDGSSVAREYNPSVITGLDLDDSQPKSS